ncbi:hypothetical protein DNTS_013293 [Danionella cerebrum]|uniref:ZP domain-containing protein n=1 Tax=Danionella cerebrum TaxID=2873325 RepID=A0A553PWP2_9TELE|nr:hypothetical protein DNTS_013293 [Danionella translucida]
MYRVMERVVLSFCCVFHFFALLHTAGAHSFGVGGPQDYSNVASTEQLRPWARGNEFIGTPPVSRPYHVFPMFQHFQVPLANTELFRPLPERRQLPRRLASLLVPQVTPQRVQVSPARNVQGVEVWCGYSKVSVRVNKHLLGFRSSPYSFQLGTCPVSRFDQSFLYFHYDLNDCDGALTMRNGQIVYSNIVRYIPEPQGKVIRAVPLVLNIQCLYNRFHHSYKIGFLPVLRERVFHKVFERTPTFQIHMCNEHWERLEGREGFVLGEPMYFEVSAAHTSLDERVFVDSCYASAYSDPKLNPQHAVYGGQQEARKSLWFSYEALKHHTVFSRCLSVTTSYRDVSIHNSSTSTRAKSCTYDNEEQRWEELYSDDSVCACCDYTCEGEQTSYLPNLRPALITSKPWVWDNDEQPLLKSKERLDQLEDLMKFKSVPIISEKEDGRNVEIVTDSEEPEEPEFKKMRSKDLDVEVMVDSEVHSTELKGELPVRPGDVMSPGEEKDFSKEIWKGGLTPKSLNKSKIAEEPSFELTGELLEDVEEARKIEQWQSTPFPKTLSIEELESEDFENKTVLSTELSLMVIDEEMFLNGKQEPAEWKED